MCDAPPSRAEILPANARDAGSVTAQHARAPEVILDLSRLLSRAKFTAPTGVDRVEMAYARRLLERAPARVSFAAVHPSGFYGRLPAHAAAKFLEVTAAAWRGEGASPERTPAVAVAAQLWRLFPALAREPIADRLRSRVYLQVSPHHLDRPGTVRRILRREGARFVCLVHDLIPIEFPEYARPAGSAQHRRRMSTVAALADGVIVTSESVRRSLQAHLGRDLAKSTAIRTIPLGAERRTILPGATQDVPGAKPYFVVIGTIEPRKNHLLLLNLWRQLVEELGPEATPKLLLIGRRGWENENILDMLDRCPSLKGVVEEVGHVGDAQMGALVQGARALLMPSFAEGFGLPIVEALQVGTPVLCSDIPTHRQVAGDAAEFLDSLDGSGWRRVILEYASPDSRRRAAQIVRLAAWRAPSWEDHVDAALDLINEISR